jgi:hypothetical protein
MVEPDQLVRARPGGDPDPAGADGLVVFMPVLREATATGASPTAAPPSAAACAASSAASEETCAAKSGAISPTSSPSGVNTCGKTVDSALYVVTPPLTSFAAASAGDIPR